VELADKLAARGYGVEPLNGDIPQHGRERTVEKLKQGKIDILVATDVVARGLDVERVSHVINYDIPYDTEPYIHRIGRTGRAGRQGDAILFISHREKRMLQSIEKATRQKIEPMTIPTLSQLNESRLNRFKQNVVAALEDDSIEVLIPIVESLQQQTEAEPERLMAAFAQLAQGSEPLILNDKSHPDLNEKPRRDRTDKPANSRGRKQKSAPEKGMQRYRIEVGRKHQVKPGNIVGAIANEADIDSKHIGAIEIYEHFSTVDLPQGMPKQVHQTLQKTRVAGQKLNIREWQDQPPGKANRKKTR
jgi:ATP-dependent RNA helicase DeaD